MVPGLEERLLNGSEEETLHIADLVRPYSFSEHISDFQSSSYKKVLQMLGLMTRRV